MKQIVEQICKVAIPQRLDCEKPASPLKVLPENVAITVIVVYSIRYNNENIVQGWFTPDPAEQFSNPYLGIGNNPVNGYDPNGEFFIIPHISFGSGYFDFGVTVGIGLPFTTAAQATIGHTFQEGKDNTYASIGVSVGGLTASVGIGTQTGFTASVGYGFVPEAVVNTSMFSVGISWSQNYGASLNAFGASYGKSGFSFSPSVGFSRGFEVGQRPVYGFIDGIACSDCDAIVNLPEIGIIGYQFGVFYKPSARAPYAGFWGGLEYVMTGGIANGNKYDWDGNFVGFAPTMGTAPVPGGPKLARYLQQLEKARKLYPKKTKIENHHRAPKYMGGDPKGPTVPIPGSYHQMITNEFRTLYPYGSGTATPNVMNRIMNQVYDTYPLPPFIP